ncbi:MAG: hypothetical protein INQ03_01835 [Candidatus Heimdallarchaeota archaeon]|nr:hypothetical protein [Candidatus Heimdallarchaeota archaeon]
MTISLRFIRSKRAVSPVIASLLIIALSVAAGVAVNTVFSNLDSTPTVETTDDTLIGTNIDSDELDVSISLVKSSYDLAIYSAEEKKYYTSIKVQLTYESSSSGPDFMYVFDVDIFVYGEKLDEIATWSIDGVQGASMETDAEGNFMGYKQAKGQSATYTVVLSDVSNKQARVPYETSFTYRAKFGQSPGIIDQYVEAEEISKIVFNVIRYNVTIFHYGQNLADTTSSLFKWVNTININNGSNKIYFLFDVNEDIYDISNNDHINRISNFTEWSSYTHLVLFAEWAIHNDASAIANQIHKANIPMAFAGTVEHIWDQLNSTATELITGTIPRSSFINQLSKWVIANNYYQFNTSLSSLLVDIAGVEENPYLDADGYDAATINSTIAHQLGISHIELLFKFGLFVLFNHTGVLLSLKEANSTLGTNIVTSFVIDHRSATYVDTVYRNMLFYAFQDPERIIISNARITIDSFTMTDIADRRDNFREDPEFRITATVSGGDISTANFTISMEESINWRSTSGTADIVIGGSTPRFYTGVAITIVETGSSDDIVINLGALHGILYDGDTIEIIINRLDSQKTFTILWLVYPFAAKYSWVTSDGASGQTSNTINPT